MTETGDNRPVIHRNIEEAPLTDQLQNALAAVPQFLKSLGF